MRHLLLACLTILPLTAQERSVTSGFFAGDARAVAVACADRAGASRVRDAHELAELGRVFLLNGERDKANEAFARAKAEESKDAEVCRLIGYAWLKAGDRSAALKNYEAMETVDPSNKEAFRRAALDLMEAGLAPEADEMMLRAWAMDTDEWKPMVDFGRAALRVRRKDLAAKWFAKATQAKPDEDKLWTAIALAYADNGGTR